MPNSEKPCTVCGEVKPLADFHRDRRSASGLRANCKVCQRAYLVKRAAWIPWEAANPDAKRAKDARRRARQRGATPELFTQAELYALWADADAWACVFCGAPWEHIEHFVPLARGGDHALGNLWPACAACNLSKSDSDPWVWLRSRGVPGV